MISAERGLYQCWNKAAQLANQPYLYYSTICDVITESGLRKLTEAIMEKELDVVISPPKIVSENGVVVQAVKWPIHYVTEHLNYTGDLAVYQGSDLAHLICVFLPATILGSSASNLYRSSVIKENPFPLNVGMVGDSLWAVKYLPNLKVGIFRKEYATFCWDGVRNGTWDEDGTLMMEFQREADALRRENPLPHVEGVVLNSVNDYLHDERQRFYAALKEYDDYVKFLTRPFGVKAKDVILKYTSIRYWLGRMFPRE